MLYTFGSRGEIVFKRPH